MTVDLTVRDVAAAIAATPDTVRRLVADGLLPGAYRLRGNEGPWRIPAAALDTYRERQTSADPWVRTRARSA